MRILFISATRIGDAVLSTGLLDHLIRQYPQARFTVACGPVAQGVFARMPRCDRVIVVDKKPWNWHWVHLWAQTVGTVWDLVVDLRGSAISLLLPTRRRAIMRGGRRPGHRLGHLAAVLNVPVAPMPVAWIGPGDHERAAQLLPCDQPVIGLGPTANWAGKVWPADRFVALFRALAAGPLPGARPAVFAGPGTAERAMAQAVLQALPDAIDLVGLLSLPEAAACLQRCALFVGNDSGLMHLSAAAGAATLGLFGPSSADEYAPSGLQAAYVQAKGAPGKADIAALPVEKAMAAAMHLLHRGASKNLPAESKTGFFQASERSELKFVSTEAQKMPGLQTGWEVFRSIHRS